MRSMFLNLVTFLMIAMPSAWALDENRSGVVCASADGLKLDITLPDTFWKSFALKVEEGTASETLEWVQGSEPGQPTRGNSDTNIVKDIDASVFTLSARKIDGRGGFFEMYALPANFKVNRTEFAREVSFTAKVSLFLVDAGIKGNGRIVECKGRM